MLPWLEPRRDLIHAASENGHVRREGETEAMPPRIHAGGAPRSHTHQKHTLVRVIA